MSLLHTGSETGRNESKQYFGDTWKASCGTRTYELEDGTQVWVTVFMADFIEGMGARSGSDKPLPVTGAYQYAVEIHPREEYQRPVTTAYGDLDKSRLTPAMPGETRMLLAWEAALDETERLLDAASKPASAPDLGQPQARPLGDVAELARKGYEQELHALAAMFSARLPGSVVRLVFEDGLVRAECEDEAVTLVEPDEDEDGE